MPKKWTEADTEFWTAPEDDPIPPEDEIEIEEDENHPEPMTWEEREAFSQKHPWKCACGLCDGTGDPVGAVKVLGHLRWG